MTTLQLNLHAELDQAVDVYVDLVQQDIADSGEQLAVDAGSPGTSSGTRSRST